MFNLNLSFNIFFNNYFKKKLSFKKFNKKFLINDFKKDYINIILKVIKIF